MWSFDVLYVKQTVWNVDIFPRSCAKSLPLMLFVWLSVFAIEKSAKRIVGLRKVLWTNIMMGYALHDFKYFTDNANNTRTQVVSHSTMNGCFQSLFLLFRCCCCCWMKQTTNKICFWWMDCIRAFGNFRCVLVLDCVDKSKGENHTQQQKNAKLKI